MQEKQYLERLLNKNSANQQHKIDKAGDKSHRSQKSHMESVIAQPSSSIVKNLINRNPRILNVARKLQN